MQSKMYYFTEKLLMMKANILVVGMVLLFFSVGSAQDTISKRKWRFAFQLDNRFSSIKGTDITIFGAKIGLQYKNLTRIGVGGSFILNPVLLTYYDKKTKTTENDNIKFWYLSVFNDWIVFKNKRWECFLTEQIGYGKPLFTTEVKRLKKDIVSDVELNLFVNEVSGQANYKIASWIGAGAGFGYRNILNTSSDLKSVFNAPIYIMKIIVYPEGFLTSH